MMDATQADAADALEGLLAPSGPKGGPKRRTKKR